MRPSMVLGLFTLAVCCGCGDIEVEGRREASGSIGGAGLQSVEAAGAPAAVSDAPAASAPAPDPAAQPPQPAAGLPAAGELVRDKAQAGVTGKGDYAPGLITTPLAMYFRLKEEIVFNIQIKKTMDLYQATNGFYPRSHEEFMQEIIAAGAIVLPELPAGHRYVYDPQTAELLVEHPAPQ